MRSTDGEKSAGTGAAKGERVLLVPWAEGDSWLLRRTNSPEMTAHLGGPESEEKLASRHRRYLALEPGCMYRVALAGGGEGADAGASGDSGVVAETGVSGETVGSIGFWEREWRGETVWETGWGVLPEYQGRGLAAEAARAVIRAARAYGGHRYLHAFPSVDHAASSAVCRRAGFTLLGTADFEYPKGHWITSNDWRVDLEAPADELTA
ncbi:GNAT family N-acetyltransferase [Streptomyces sp. 7R007]